MYTVDRSASPPRQSDRAANHMTQSSSSSTASTSSTKSGYKLFPTVELTPPPVRSRPAGPRRSVSLDDGFGRPTDIHQYIRPVKTLAARRGRKINLSLLKTRVASAVVSSPIPEVTVTAASSPRTQLQVPIELGRSKSTGDESSRPKLVSLGGKKSEQQPRSPRSPSSSAASTPATVKVVDIAAAPSSAPLPSPGSAASTTSKRKLTDHLAPAETKKSIEPSAASTRRIHHTRQSSSLSTLGSDDVAYFGSAGLSTLSATKQCYSPLGTGLQVREVMVSAPSRDRLSRRKTADTTRVSDGSDSDTCVPPPLFTSGPRARSRGRGIVTTQLPKSASGDGIPTTERAEEKEERKTPKSAPPTQTTHHRPATPGSQAVPTFIKVASAHDMTDEPPMPKLVLDTSTNAFTIVTEDSITTGPDAQPSNVVAAPLVQETSAQAQAPAVLSTETAIATVAVPVEAAAIIIPARTSASQDKSLPNIPATEPEVPSSRSVSAPAATATSAAAKRVSTTKIDPVRRLIDLTKQTDAIHTRYETLRAQRLKQTTAIAASLKEFRVGPEFVNLLLSQHQALNATNSSLDICVAKLKSLGSKKEKAMAVIIAQGKGKPIGDDVAIEAVKAVNRDDRDDVQGLGLSVCEQVVEAIEGDDCARDMATPKAKAETVAASASTSAQGAEKLDKKRDERRRSIRSSAAGVNPRSPFSDDEAVMSVKARRSRMKAERSSKTVAPEPTTAVAAVETAAPVSTITDIKPETQQAAAIRPVSPAPVELAAEVPATFVARQIAHRAPSAPARPQTIASSASTKAQGRRIPQRAASEKAAQIPSVYKAHPPPPPMPAQTPAAIAAQPPSRTPPPPPAQPPRTPPRMIRPHPSYRSHKSAHHQYQKQADSAIALSTSTSTLASGASSIKTSSTSTTSRGGYYSSSPSEDHEARTPGYFDEDYYFNDDVLVEEVEEEDEEEDEDANAIPRILLPAQRPSIKGRAPARTSSRMMHQHAQRGVLGSQHRRDVLRREMAPRKEKGPEKQGEQEPVKVLSCEAERFWEFCEGSFRLSRSVPCGEYRV